MDIDKRSLNVRDEIGKVGLFSKVYFKNKLSKILAGFYRSTSFPITIFSYDTEEELMSFGKENYTEFLEKNLLEKNMKKRSRIC